MTFLLCHCYVKLCTVVILKPFQTLFFLCVIEIIEYLYGIHYETICSYQF